MTTDSVLRQVCQIAADIFNLSVDAITAQSSPETIGGWDSLQHVNLVLALEQSFDVQFLPEEMVEMVTIQRMASLVDEKMCGVAGP